MSYLIVGLGNPGAVYESTRHNMGFRVLKALASQWGWVFKSDSALAGKVSQGSVANTQILLLQPSTFMNRSGEAVKACIDKFKVPLDQVLVVSDDVALPLGTLRLRSRGSAGGHNGLKSIEAHLGTQHYARLRIGVGSPETSGLSDYVLAPFLPEEERLVTESIQKALEVLEIWMKQGLPAAMQRANARKKKEKEEESEGEKENE